MSSEMRTSKGQFNLVTSTRTLSRWDGVQERAPPGQRGEVQGTIWWKQIETSKEVWSQIEVWSLREVQTFGTIVWGEGEINKKDFWCV